MANGTYEMLWLKIQLSKQGNIKSFVPMNLHCDNVVAIHTASNPMYHVYGTQRYDCHFVSEKVTNKGTKAHGRVKSHVTN